MSEQERREEETEGQMEDLEVSEEQGEEVTGGGGGVPGRQGPAGEGVNDPSV